MENNAISLSQPSSPAARPTVLIVDDSRLMRVAIKKILKDEFELIEAVDGEDAWARIETEPAIACIFSDLSMPNLDGYGLLARVRGATDARVRELPFIVITGKEGDLGGLLEEVRGHGATDLVGKPFKSDEIIARTRSLLEGEAPAAGGHPGGEVADAVSRNEQGAVEGRQADEAQAQRAAAEAEARRAREEQDAARRAEEAARMAAEQEQARIAAEAQAQREAAEAEARRVREEQDAARRAEEAARMAAEQEQARIAAEAQAQREAAEAEARRVREEQDAARRAEEAARVAAEQAEQARIAAEAQARQAEEEARICAELRAKVRLEAEARERQRLAEEAAQRMNPLQKLLLRLVLPLLSLGNRLLRLGKDEALAKLRRRL